MKLNTLHIFLHIYAYVFPCLLPSNSYMGVSMLPFTSFKIKIVLRIVFS